MVFPSDEAADSDEVAGSGEAAGFDEAVDGADFDDTDDVKCLERILYERVGSLSVDEGSLSVDSEPVAYAGLVEP